MSEQVELPAFGKIEASRLVAINDFFATISDRYPVSPGHTLIIARRPVVRFQDLTSLEKEQLIQSIDSAQQHLTVSLNPPPDGFNFGLNDGRTAGQTILQ